MELTKQSADRLLAQEHERLNRLMDELRKETAVVPRGQVGRWITRVRESFEHFEAHYIKHMALEEQGGYMAPVVDEQRPTLSREVARLAHQHGEFLRLMKSIRDEARQLDDSDSIMVRDWVCRVSRLLSYVEQHEHEEDLLLIEGLSREIGAKD